MEKDDFENTKNKKDKSIIDVNLESLDLSISKEINMKIVSIKTHRHVPKWKKKHLYSQADLLKANKEQIEFYNHFRETFIRNKFTDLEGNVNYAVILYFELIESFEEHQDLGLIEEHFALLNKCCPEIASYTKSKLNELEKESIISDLIDKLNRTNAPQQSKLISQLFKTAPTQPRRGRRSRPKSPPKIKLFDPDEGRLGRKYKEKLNLSEKETSWLNKFNDPTNAFSKINNECLFTICIQYILILKKLNKELKAKKGNLAMEVYYFTKKIKDSSKSNSSYYSKWAEEELIRGVESSFFLNIFKRVENSVRERFAHNRKLNTTYFTFEKKLTEEYEMRVGNTVNELIEKFKDRIQSPDNKTEIKLNSSNPHRWKIKFKQLTEAFEVEKKDEFNKNISILVSQNIKNKNLKVIFFAASKFIAKYDQVKSLKYYVKYFCNGLNSSNFKEKRFIKTLEKILFKTEKQKNSFDKILSDLSNKKIDIDEALLEVPKIYITKRKKIKLSKNEIQKIEKKHVGTVELLNEYLEDNDKPEVKQKNPKTKPKKQAKKAEIAKSKSIFIAGLDFTEIQEKLIAKIVNNSFNIDQGEVAKIALENNLFKNQLIDGINELCLEYLNDEALIEEDEDDYIIEESFYKLILKK